jgi:hypothetical protein
MLVYLINFLSTPLIARKCCEISKEKEEEKKNKE